MSTYKVVILGDGAVGKSALTVQLVRNTFVTEYDPTIESCYRTTIEVNNYPVVLDILDTAGQEELSAMRDQYIRCGDGFILVYSIIEKSSYSGIDLFKDQVLRVKDQANYFPMVVCGNKADLDSQRLITQEEAKAHFDEMGIVWMETSAKTKTNVTEAFASLVREIMKFNGQEPGVKEKDKKKGFSGCHLL